MQTCQFARYASDGYETFRCAELACQFAVLNRQHDLIWLCDTHRYWMPDMKFWTPEPRAGSDTTDRSVQ
jgi:hypothetical protein